MTRALLVAAVLAGCHRETPRDRDCATVRTLLQPPPHRRYYDYDHRHDSTALPESSAQRTLQTATYHDADVAAAVKAVGDAGWTFYTPYATGHEAAERDAAFNKLADLCHLERRRVIVQ
ncbi:MAG: hypothetical protein JO257_13755 [Deltaproteobacteria bacterium]|nr:hypothetical protein [Deltaproteobacteria bacterium]